MIGSVPVPIPTKRFAIHSADFMRVVLSWNVTSTMCADFSANLAGIDVLVDSYTLAHKRQVRLVTSIFTDIAVRHPESFAKIADLKYNA